MVRTALLASLLAATSSVLSAKITGASFIPGAYLVEYEDGHAPSTNDLLKDAGTTGQTRMNLDFELFKGASIQLDDLGSADESAAKIAALPSVKSLWPLQLRSIPKPEIKWTGGDSTPSSDPAVDARAAAAKDTFSPHVMTQVSKLRADGISGQGFKIAVIDTGIDYTHPALGGCFGKGCLVSFGTDLVGDNYTGFNTPHPDPDPQDCAGHGTHVAGIIAAQPNPLGFTGVAPGVTLGIYRVLGCGEGSVTDDILIAAYNMAFAEKPDIITASIGGASGWSEEPWAVVVQRIVQRGVPCTIAAGNDGAEGIFFASGASDGVGVTSVASYDNVLTPSILHTSTFTVDGGAKKDFGYTVAAPDAWGGVKLPLYAPDLDPTVPNGGCDPYPKSTPNLAGKIVLVRRGVCDFTVKAQNAVDFGAKYLIIYNDVPGTIQIDVSTVPGIVSAAMVTPKQGVAWIKDLKAGHKVVLNMVASNASAISVVSPVNSITGGALSTYTSWGPTNDGNNKPQFGAPGGNILSTWPVALGSYAVISGTSMATPHTAGVLALVAQVRKTNDPTTLTDVISAYSKANVFNDGVSYYDFIAPVAQQGGGLVQAYDAAHASSLLTPSSLAFNDSDNFAGTLKFTIKNLGSKKITYKVSHVPSYTFYTLGNDTIYPDPFPNTAVKAHASIQFGKTTTTIDGVGGCDISVKVTPPKGLDASRLPVYSGYIAVNGSDGSAQSITYQGIAGSLHDATVLASDGAYITQSNDTVNLAPVPANHLFTLPKKGTNDSSADLPTIAADLAMGSPLVLAHVVPVSPPAGEKTTTYKGYKTIGVPAGFPDPYLPRTVNAFNWNGQLLNGKYAPAGKYKIVVHALHIFGDAKNAKDWDVSETPAFRIQYEK